MELALWIEADENCGHSIDYGISNIARNAIWKVERFQVDFFFQLERSLITAAKGWRGNLREWSITSVQKMQPLPHDSNSREIVSLKEKTKEKK